MSAGRMRCPLYVRTAAEDLRGRLQEASKEGLIDMVVQLYTLSRLSAIEADNFAEWLKDIMNAHDVAWHEPGLTISCHPAHHLLVRGTIQPKWFETIPISGRILASIWQALGSFNDDDAAERAALDALDDDDESTENDNSAPGTAAQVTLEYQDDDGDNNENDTAATVAQDALENGGDKGNSNAGGIDGNEQEGRGGEQDQQEDIAPEATSVVTMETSLHSVGEEGDATGADKVAGD